MTDPEKAKDRTVTLRAAVLGALGALLAGMATAAFGLIGAYVTSGSNSEQARLEFLRPQQQALYAKFLSAVDQANLAIAQEDAAGVPTSEQLDAASTSVDTVAQLVKELELVASQATNDAAADVQNRVRSNYLDMHAAYCDANQTDPDCLPVVFRLPSSGSVEKSPREVFVDNARGDLGSDAN